MVTTLISVRKNNQEKSRVATVLDGAIVACLFLFALGAPNSIAVTQTAWLLGMALWLARFAFYPRPKVYRTPVDYFLFGFFILSGLSSFLSYEPMVSIGKLRRRVFHHSLFDCSKRPFTSRGAAARADPGGGFDQSNVVYSGAEKGFSVAA